MQNVLVNLSSCDCSLPTDGCNIYTNLDAVGNADGELSGTPVNPRPIPLFPGMPPDSPVHLTTPHLSGPFLGMSGDTSPQVEAEIGPVHFGRLKVGLKSVDAAGNEQDGAAAEEEITVNSSPRPPTNVQRGDYDDEASQQAFSFTPSRQLV